MTTPVLSPKMAALRELVLHALATSTGGGIRSAEGFVPRRIVEQCRIPDTETNRGNVSMILGALEAQGLITRDHSPASKRTYAATLMEQLSKDRIAELEHNLEMNRKKFLPQQVQQPDVAPAQVEVVDFDELLSDCRRAHEAFLAVARATSDRSPEGYVKTTSRRVFQGLGFKGLTSARVRHYLRRLYRARAVRSCKDGSSLWLWEITEGEITAAALRAIVARDPFVPRSATESGDGPRDAARTTAGQVHKPASTTVTRTTSPVTAETVEEDLVHGVVAELLAVIEDRDAQIARLTEELRARGWTPAQESSPLDRAQAIIRQHRSEKR